MNSNDSKYERRSIKIKQINNPKKSIRKKTKNEFKMRNINNLEVKQIGKQKAKMIYRNMEGKIL